MKGISLYGRVQKKPAIRGGWPAFKEGGAYGKFKAE